MAAELKVMESGTALHSRITYLAPCWVELFTLRSFIKTHAIATRARRVSNLARCTLYPPRWSRGAMMGNGSRIIRVCSVTSPTAAISNLYYPASDRGASLVIFNGLAGTGADAVSNLIREFVLKRITSHVPK